jgi:hypothetical protein
LTLKRRPQSLKLRRPPADICASRWRAECLISGARARAKSITGTGAGFAKMPHAADAVTRENLAPIGADNLE